MAKVKLPCGRSFLIDDEDLAFLEGRSWFSKRQTDGLKNLHVCGRLPGERGTQVALARLILGLTNGDGHVVDFKNLNGLDCRRRNIRKTTRAVAAAHQRKKRRDKQFKGVFLDRRTGRYYAQIAIEGKRHYGGSFDDPYLAAVAYDLLALKHHKEFALTNEMQNA